MHRRPPKSYSSREIYEHARFLLYRRRTHARKMEKPAPPGRVTLVEKPFRTVRETFVSCWRFVEGMVKRSSYCTVLYCTMLVLCGLAYLT